MSLCCGALTPVCPRRLCQRHVRGLVAVVRNLIAIACPRMTSRRRVAMMWRTRASVSVTFITRHAVTTGPASRSRIGSGCSYSDSGVISAHDLMSARRHAVTHSRQRIRDVYIGVMHPASRSCFDSVCSYSDSDAMSAHDIMSAHRHVAAYSRQRVRDVRVGVTRPASRS